MNLDILVLTLIIIVFSRVLWGIIKVNNSVIFLKKFPKLKDNSRKKYYVVIPLLREQSTLPNLLEVLNSISSNIYFVLVTTEKEIYEYNLKIKDKFNKLKYQLCVIESKKEFIKKS